MSEGSCVSLQNKAPQRYREQPKLFLTIPEPQSRHSLPQQAGHCSRKSPYHDLVGLSVCQTARSPTPTVSQPVIQLASQLSRQTINQSFNQSYSQQMNQPITHLSVSQPTSKQMYSKRYTFSLFRFYQNKVIFCHGKLNYFLNIRLE
jgi:hypothetical protein